MYSLRVQDIIPYESTLSSKTLKSVCLAISSVINCNNSFWALKGYVGSIILPTGNLKRNIFNTTVYLIPFQPRDFGCAYLPTSSDVSPNLNDENIEKTK